MDIVTDMFGFELLSHNACQIIRVCRVWWHFHTIDKQLALQTANLLLLSQPSVKFVSVLIELRQKEKFWDQLRIAAISADSIIQTLKTIFCPISVLGCISENEGACIRLESLQKEHVCEEG